MFGLGFPELLLGLFVVLLLVLVLVGWRLLLRLVGAFGAAWGRGSRKGGGKDGS